MKRDHKVIEKGILINGIRSIDNFRDRCFFTILYLTCCRRGEVLAMRVGDLTRIDGGYLFNMLNEKHRPPMNRKIIPIMDAVEDPIFPSLMTTVALLYEKNQGMDKDNKIFPISRETVRKKCDKYFNTTTHSFRHTRTTHYNTIYGYSEPVIAKLRGDVDTKMASRYTHLRHKDIIDHMLSKL